MKILAKIIVITSFFSLQAAVDEQCAPCEKLFVYWANSSKTQVIARCSKKYESKMYGRKQETYSFSETSDGETWFSGDYFLPDVWKDNHGKFEVDPVMNSDHQQIRQFLALAVQNFKREQVITDKDSE